ncbi:MAG: porin [Candidatus Polarisedimenticolaceae bacterium]|nr:porin [Candidatus Polarisedimenticolaceae bacterium]
MAKVLADYSDIEDVSKQYNVAVVVPVAKSTKVALGLNTLDPDASGADTVQEWYANVTYKFPAQKNVSLFAEIGDTDEDDVDMGYLAGLRIKF